MRRTQLNGGGNQRVLKVFLIFISACCPFVANAVNVNGSISASTVTVTGTVFLSSMTVSSLTVANLLDLRGTAPELPNSVVQMDYSSTTITTFISSATFAPVEDLKLSFALSNASNYVRISLSGMLSSQSGSLTTNLTIKRDSTDLGNPNGSGLALATSHVNGAFHAWRSVGIVITDSPGDTSVHEYKVYLLAQGAGNIAGFPHVAGYLIAEEITR